MTRLVIIHTYKNRLGLVVQHRTAVASMRNFGGGLDACEEPHGTRAIWEQGYTFTRHGIRAFLTSMRFHRTGHGFPALV